MVNDLIVRPIKPKRIKIKIQNVLAFQYCAEDNFKDPGHE